MRAANVLGPAFTSFFFVDISFTIFREKYKSILPEAEYKKLEAMTEDDNPCLLKLYFKK